MRQSRAMLLAAITMAASIPTEASAMDAPASVVSFLNFLKANNRDAAVAIVNGSVSQATGSPGSMEGGPRSGPWRNRIIEGLEAVSAAQAFATFADCTLGSYGPVKSEAEATLRVRVIYNCPHATGIHFLIEGTAHAEKVQMSELGQSLYVIQDGKAVLWGLDQ